MTNVLMLLESHMGTPLHSSHSLFHQLSYFLLNCPFLINLKPCHLLRSWLLVDKPRNHVTGFSIDPLSPCHFALPIRTPFYSFFFFSILDFTLLLDILNGDERLIYYCAQCWAYFINIKWNTKWKKWKTVQRRPRLMGNWCRNLNISR